MAYLFFLKQNIIKSSMGADQFTIKYANKAEYNGSVKCEIPEGNGKLTFKNGSSFEGQFVQGEPKLGKIRNGDFVYQGQCTKSQIRGKGMLIDKTNTFYEGQFESGKLINGEILKKNKKNEVIATFKGEIQNFSPFSGKGVMQISLQEVSNEKYIAQKKYLEGTFKNANLHGKGKYILPNNDIYEGQFFNGKANKQGEYKSKQFTITGEFVNNNPEGNCQIYFKNGDSYDGRMREGQMHGKGKYVYRDGTIYKGDFYFGTLWGECTIQYPKGSQIEKYEGQINEGQYNGIGVLYYSNGVIFKGYFLQGAKNGYGVFIYGKDKYKCLYLMDELSGELTMMDS